MDISPTTKDYHISTEPFDFDNKLIHSYLSKESYWGGGATLAEVEDLTANSLCYGVYLGTQQVGFASVETDFESFAYLSDIFILEPHRGQGLSQWLIGTILSDPAMQAVDSWMLMTDDAHGLYEKFGFKAVEGSTGQMERTGSTHY